MCDTTCRTEMSRLPCAANSGQYEGDRSVEREQTAIHQQQQAHRHHALGAGEDRCDRQAVPRLLARAVRDAAPQVDDQLAVDPCRERRAEISVLGEVVGERRADAS